ncbi:MAG: hypothetical protein K0S56_1553 [Microvirga sp.]|jgi:hypothetical protein|nr:hypothetical protein [Microvirga sp.]
MKCAVPLAIAITLVGPAWAQTPAANSDTPHVTLANSQQAAEPGKGANSFTEDQARSRIEDRGFSGVTGLKKDGDGIWRGKATKNGAAIDVAVDYQGNVFPN